MLMNTLTNPSLLALGLILMLVQTIAALPWLHSLLKGGLTALLSNKSSASTFFFAVLGGGLVIALYIAFMGQSEALSKNGRYFAALLHVQLLVDFFLLAPWLVSAILPKTGAVCLAAFREGCRQPLFWLVSIFAVIMLALSIVIPYFTFGDDYKMMKQIGFDIIMLSAGIFGVLAASISISEEIEGRTAITLLSKPITRRQFLLGKFLGIFLAAVFMSLILGWFLNWALWAMPEFDSLNKSDDPLPLQAKQTLVPLAYKIFPGTAGKVFGEGMAFWFSDALAHHLGVLLGIGQVMILVALASALATRLPFIINLVICLVIYFLAHLAPAVVKVTDKAGGNTTAKGLVKFLGQLFDTILPALEFFNMGPAVIREIPLNLWQFAIYVGTVLGYSLIYTTIAIVVGLLLFEDRDLA